MPQNARRAPHHVVRGPSVGRDATIRSYGTTEMVAVALCPSTVAVIVAFPTACAVTRPSVDTLATMKPFWLVRTLAVQLAPIRVNAIHPGIVGDTPEWADKPPAVLDAVRARTPLGRLVTTEEIVGASVFLLENGAVNGVSLEVDGGWMLQ